MNLKIATLDRAFQLADKCYDINELRLKLRREGRSDYERALFGVGVRNQLQGLMLRRK